MRTMMLITIVTLITMNMAKSEENKVTPKEFMSSVVAVPGTIVNHVKGEWSDIKDYQKKSWQKGKEQNAKNLKKVKSFFANLTKGNAND